MSPQPKKKVFTETSGWLSKHLGTLPKSSCHIKLTLQYFNNWKLSLGRWTQKGEREALCFVCFIQHYFQKCSVTYSMPDQILHANSQKVLQLIIVKLRPCFSVLGLELCACNTGALSQRYTPSLFSLFVFLLEGLTTQLWLGLNSQLLAQPSE